MACSPAASAPRTSPAPANCSRRQSFPLMPSRQSTPMLPRRKRQISAHAAAAAWSSSSGSNAAQLRTTERARQRQRSGSTPHDPITADQRALPDLFLLARRPPQPSSHSSSQFADCCTRNRSLQPATPSLAATSSSSLNRKTFSASIPLSFRQHRRRAQIPIALLPHQSPAAALVHYLPTRFRALALFSRRPSERVVRSSLPAAENLHKTRDYRTATLAAALRQSTDIRVARRRLDCSCSRAAEYDRIARN